MLNVVIFGPPGSGKGTQSQKIIEKYGLKHISTGDILREEIKRGSPLGVIAKQHIDKGHLVPDELIIRMLDDTLKGLNGFKGVIFDGFPRTVNQAAALDQLLAAKQEKVDVMLNLDVEQDELIRRLQKRGEVSGRSDDNPETIEQRIRVYEQSTLPVIDYYKQNDVFYPVKGQGSIDDIFARIVKIIDSVK